MNPFKLIARFVGFLWQTAMLIRYPFDSGLRIGSRAAGLYMFLVLFFLFLGLVLVALGFDLNRIDLWLDRHAGAIDWIASLIFQLICGLIFLVSLGGAAALVFTAWRTVFPPPVEVGAPEPHCEGGDDDAEVPGREPLGAGSLGCWALFLLLVAYFAWFGMIG